MTIDPEFLEELDRFEAALDQETSAIKKGEQESPRIGEGLTFSDYRRYYPGDDTKLIDWKLFARTEEYFIKQFEEERSLTVHILLDASASMDFGEQTEHKFEYGAKIGLGFAYLTVKEHNDFIFCTFRERAERLDAGRSNRGGVLSLIDILNDTTPSAAADIQSVLTAYADRLRTRSLVVVISDCLADPDSIESGTTALTREDADVLVVQPIAPDERNPNVVGDSLFVDPETGDTQRSYFNSPLAESYESRLNDHVEEVKERVTSHSGDHIIVDTGTEYFDSFANVWLD